MNITVPVKCIAQLDEEFDLRRNGAGVDLDGFDRKLNEWDSVSLKAAVQVEDHRAAIVQTVTTKPCAARGGLQHPFADPALYLGSYALVRQTLVQSYR